MKITNYRKDGSIIKDMSKVTLPKELSIEIFELLNPHLKVITINQSELDKLKDSGNGGMANEL